MSEENNLPDWLRQLRDQQMGSNFRPAQPTGPAAQETEATIARGSLELTRPSEQITQETPPSPAGEFDALREIASAEPPAEERPGTTLPILGQLSPFQRFVLALMLFLNVSVLGCLFLMVAGKITLMR